MIPINEPNQPETHAFLSLGFRPFFLGAGVSSALLMLIWFFIYPSNNDIINNMSSQYWHAHEMIFAYTMAVIAGFLLTAVKNWTGLVTIQGRGLLALFLLWLSARLLPFIDAVPLIIQAIVDSSFLVFTLFFVTRPIVKAKSWNNIGIASKIALMAISHIVFYLGLLGILEHGVIWGLYSAFYMVLALIFVMARRVVPFFIEKGVEATQPIKNYLWLDRASLILFVAYYVIDVFWPSDFIYLLAFALLLLHGVRLVSWHHKGIWSHPLLWSLYLAYVFLTLGFGLKTLAYFNPISNYIILHSFALGIGMITLAMMSRVALGHTGRSVFNAPKLLTAVFLALALAFVFRVILPLLFAQQYLLWVSTAQVLWALSFLIFSALYIPILLKKNV